MTFSWIIGYRRPTRAKMSPYECGMTPVGDARERFSVKFYLVAMLFILFDVEAVFLYPWAVILKELKMFGFWEMLIYIGIVLVGLLYVWKKGVLDWNQVSIAARGRVMAFTPPITDLEELKSHPALAKLLAWRKDAVTGAKFDREELTIWIDAGAIRDVCAVLRDEAECPFNYLCDITCVDWYPAEPRFEVVYHLLSLREKERVRLKVRLGGDNPTHPFGGFGLAGCQPFRARDFRSIRNSFHRTSEPGTSSDARRLGRPSFAKGLPC